MKTILHRDDHNRAQRDRDELVRALDLSPRASQDEVLARIRAYRQALDKAAVFRVDICEALELFLDEPDRRVVSKVVRHATAVQGLRNLLRNVEAPRLDEITATPIAKL